MLMPLSFNWFFSENQPLLHRNQTKKNDIFNRLIFVLFYLTDYHTMGNAETEIKTGFADGSFININEINFPVDSIAINRGYGAFDFFGVKNGVAFFLERHLDRFFNTMNLLNIKIRYTKDDIVKFIQEIIQLNAAENFYIKLFALPIHQPSNNYYECKLYIIPVIVEEVPKEAYIRGVSILVKEYTRFLPEAKSTNYLPVFSWYNEIINKKVIDVLYYTDSYIRETSRGNIFLVKENELFTPGRGMLKGITRSVVFDIAEKKGLACFEMDLTLEDLKNADEVFLSSTTKKILPVVNVLEGFFSSEGIGPVTASIMQQFKRIEDHWPAGLID